MRTSNFWVTRDGRRIEISKMENVHLQNVAVYLELESKVYNSTTYFRYIFSVRQELFRRNMDFDKIIAQGPQEYLNTQGVRRIWDQETNTEAALN